MSGEQEKTAGATVYLMEELSDARMRCDQLLRYVARAVKLIEASTHKDHFFEVAGDLLQGIPETLFKLNKALQATALAANRLDYEEVKQELRPEKVEELEQALKDVRIRHVQRRSDPMDPMQAIQNLRKLATEVRKTGSLPVTEMMAFIASLETKKAGALDADVVASQFEDMAYALEHPPEGVEGPSRVRLAAVLRKVLGQSLERLPSAEEKVIDKLAMRFARKASDEKESRFEEGKPADPTKDMSPEDKKKWEDNTDKYEDKFKKEAAYHVSPDKLFKSMKDSVKSLLATRVKIRDLHEMLQRINEDATGVFYTDNYDNPEIRKVRDKLYELDQQLRVFSDIEWLEKKMRPMVKKASSDEEKTSRFEEGKPADPTKDMSPEDAKKWKSNTDKYEDKFKKDAASWKVEAAKKEPEFEVGDIVRPSKSYLRSMGGTTGKINGEVKGKSGRFYRVQWSDSDEVVSVAPAALEYDPRYKNKKKASDDRSWKAA